MESYNPFFNLKTRSIVLQFFIINLAVGIILGIIAVALRFNIQDPIMTYIAYCLSFVLLCLWALQRFRQLQINLQHVIGNVPNGYRWLPIVGLVAGILIFSIGSGLLSFYFLSLLAPSVFQLVLKTILTDQTRSSLPIIHKFIEAIALIVVAPITEEFIFRGIILHRWAAKWGIIPAILGSSILFGFCHVNPIGLSMFGIVMALLYIKTSTLIVPIVAHALNNTVAVAMTLLSSGSGTKNDVVYSDWRVGALMLTLSAPFLIYFVYKRWPKKNVSLPYFANALR